MALTISIGMEKGGVGKTTTAAILSFLLSKQGKVLAIDMDAQSDLSYFLSRKSKEEFEGNTVYEACEAVDMKPYIHKITDSLHLLPSDDKLMLFDNLDMDYSDFRTVLDSVHDDYDYIVIDMPPQVGKLVLAGINASDLTICVTLAEPLSYQKIDNYLALIEKAGVDSAVKLAGILITSFDPRTAIDRAYQKAIEHHYPGILFKTVIKKKAHIKEFSHNGINDRTKADRAAIQPYQDLLKELIGIGKRYAKNTG